MEYDCERLLISVPFVGQDIDMVAEKFIHGFMNGRYMVEVFVNPSKRDIKNARDAEGAYSKNLRFIADGNTKKVYAWNAAICLHDQMLRELQSEGFIGRSTKLYHDPDVTSGEWNTNDEIELYYNVAWGPDEMGNVILDGDWAWVDKTGFKQFQMKLMKTVARQLGSNADPRILAAAGLG